MTIPFSFNLMATDGAARRGEVVSVIRGFGGAADAVTLAEVPTARFVERV